MKQDAIVTWVSGYLKEIETLGKELIALYPKIKSWQDINQDIKIYRATDSGHTAIMVKRIEVGYHTDPQFEFTLKALENLKEAIDCLKATIKARKEELK